VNISNELLLSKDAMESVRLNISGRRNSIRTLKGQEIRVKVDIGHLSAGTHSIGLSAKDVNLPLGVFIERVIPQDIKVVLSER